MQGIERLKKVTINWDTVKSGILPFASCFLLTRSIIIGFLSPFAVALCAALFLNQKGGLQAAAGCIAGALIFYSPPHALSLFVPTALSIQEIIANSLNRKPNKTITFTVYIVSAIAGIAILGSGTIHSTLTGALEAILGFILVRAFEGVLSGIKSIKRRIALTETEALSIMLAVFILLIGTAKITIGGIEFLRMLSAYCVLCFAYCSGPGLGAAAGLACGFCTSLVGEMNPILIASLGVCGLVAGECRRVGKIGSAAGFILSNSLFTLYINGSSEVILPIAELMIAAVIFAFTPKKAIDYITAVINRRNGIAFHGFKNEIIKKSIKERLGRLSEAMDMAATALNLEPAKKRKQDIARKAGYALLNLPCKGCSSRKSCWQHNADENIAIAGSMFEEYLKTGVIRQNAIQGCHSSKQFIIDAQSAFDELKHQEEEKGTLLEVRKASARNMLSLARSLRQIENEIDYNSAENTEIEGEIIERLHLAGIEAKGVAVCSEHSGMVVRLELDACGKNNICFDMAQKAVSVACGMPMQAEHSCRRKKQGSCIATFRQAGLIRAELGSASACRMGCTVCGDCLTYATLPDGREMICLCDGMGSGTSAAKVSMEAAGLIEGLFTSGLEEENVINTVNSILSMRNTEVFTTADICIIDTVKMSCRFIKTCASPSFLIREGIAERIHGPGLPLGILGEIKPAVIDRGLLCNDMIVMLSDGVSDSASEQVVAGWLSEAQKQKNAKEAAEKIIELASMQAGIKRDDMTAIAIMINPIKK